MIGVFESAQCHEVIDRTALYAELDQVVDPELDESLVQLGFIDDLQIDQEMGSVTIHLRLPTFWCSPNFAFLMANDAREAALRMDGVRRVRVVLKDHGQADEISEGVSAGRTFVDTFPDETDADLEELRVLFRGKAFGMRQEQLVRFLLDTGVSAEEVVRLRVGDLDRLPRGAAPLAQAYLERRRRVGLSGEDEALLVTALDGTPLDAEGLDAYLQSMRRQRISMTFNALMCRGLLETRYGLEVKAR